MIMCHYSDFLFHIAGFEEPNLVEVGPYVYRQKMYKTDTKFSDDGEELTHSVYREFYFDELLSISSDETYVIVPNIPLFGLIKEMADQDPTAKSVTRGLLESYSFGRDIQPFINVTVKELFWGYPSVLLSMARINELGDKCKDYDDDLFAMFDEPSPGGEEKVNCDITEGNLVNFGIFTTPNSRNGSSLDFRTVKTGK